MNTIENVVEEFSSGGVVDPAGAQSQAEGVGASSSASARTLQSAVSEARRPHLKWKTEAITSTY